MISSIDGASVVFTWKLWKLFKSLQLYNLRHHQNSINLFSHNPPPSLKLNEFSHSIPWLIQWQMYLNVITCVRQQKTFIVKTFCFMMSCERTIKFPINCEEIFNMIYEWERERERVRAKVNVCKAHMLTELLMCWSGAQNSSIMTKADLHTMYNVSKLFHLLCVLCIVGRVEGGGDGKIHKIHCNKEEA